MVPDEEFDQVPQRLVRPLNFPPGFWKRQLPKKYLDLARQGNLSRLDALLREHPEYLSKRGSHNRTLLWEAARAGKLELVRFLVDSGAEVNATGAYNSESFVQITPYCAARYYRREAVADYLRKNGSTLDVFRAAFLGDGDRVKHELADQPDLLHAEDPQDPIYYIPVLSFAVAGGHADLVSFLIGRGAAVAPYSAQLLGLAAKAARKDILDVLLSQSADVRALGVGVFVQVSDLALLADLLGKGLSPNRRGDNGFPPLVYVARGDKGEHPNKVQLLLDHGAAVNAVGPRGKTALHYAATAGHSRVTQLLLDRGADPTLLDEAGQTPLDLALAAGKSRCVEILQS